MHFATHPREGSIHSGYVSGGWREPIFYKPPDPQWSYQFVYNLGSGFRWVKKTPWTVEVDQNLQRVATSNPYTNGSYLWSYLQTLIDKEEEIVHKDQFLRQLLEASQKSRSSSTFEKKCKIFLSHAGAQKDFVEQLHEDLCGVHYFGTFFDKDDESLPKGERFPSRILKAARECDLAIVVMSDEYFRRKWPMLELASFVEAQRTRPEVKILPVFYKLSLDEFQQPQRQHSYVESWNQLSPPLSKDEVQQWKEALKVISASNGIHFHSTVGEMALRKQIVETVCKRVPPDLLWDVSNVQGKARMAEVIKENMEASNGMNPNEPQGGACFLGLYGMGGLGKTTMSHVFLNNMAQQFCGNVCYIELGSKDPLELQKQVLVQLTKLDASLVNTRVTNEAQALYLLKEHIPNQRVCLVIDNVSDEQACIGDAKAFSNLQFKEGSVVLLTSRSLQTLKKLNIKWQACFRVPALDETEAMALFSHHAGCDTSTFSEDHWIMFKKFIRSCCFNVGDGAGQEYHPLALKVLGTLVTSDVQKWRETAIDLKSINDKIHPVFSILKTSYDKLLPQRQKMFMDLALRRKKTTDIVWTEDLKFHFEYLYGEGDIDKVLEDLQAKSLIEYYNVEEGLIRIHELYREFAQMELQSEPSVHKRKCCLFRKNNIQPVHYQQQRLHMCDEDFTVLTTKMLCDCANTEMLIIEGCSKLTSVDVQDMKNLAILEIVECPQLKTVCVDDAESLISITWEGFQGEYPNLANQQSLERLWLSSNVRERHDSLHPAESLDLSGCSNLDHLLLWNIPSLPDFTHLVKLRNIRLNNCQHMKRFEGLEVLVCLEQLCISECSSLLEFPSLIHFPRMKRFLLHGAVLLKKLIGMAHMAQLESLSLKNLEKLEELLGIEACTKLTVLDLSGNRIQDFSWITYMPDLFFINFSLTAIRHVPDCSNLRKLKEIMLYGCVELESIDNLGFVQSLLKIDARRCWGLGRLPHLDGSAFTFLDISDSDINDVSCVEHCFQLEELHCARTLITTLPDLSNFQNLRVLDVQECWCLKRLDHINRLPALEVLLVWGCLSLEALPDLRSSKRLTRLDLMRCQFLDPSSVMLPSSHVHLDEEINTADNLEDHLSNFNDAEGESTFNAAEDDEYPEDEEGLPLLFELSVSIENCAMMDTKMKRALDREHIRRMLRGDDTADDTADDNTTSDMDMNVYSGLVGPLWMYMHQPIPQLPRRDYP